MRIPIHIVGINETKNMEVIHTIGHGGAGQVVYHGSRYCLDLELPDGTVITIDVGHQTLNQMCQISEEFLLREKAKFNQPPPTRFERILIGD